MKKDSVYIRVYDIALKIPKGRVLTYGLISDLMGGRISAQAVGWALKALPSEPNKTDPLVKKYNSKTVPWHRVVSKNGGMSTNKLGIFPPDYQRTLLEAEKVEFDEEGCVKMDKYLWMDGL